MPRLLIDVNETWHKRFETVISAAIDTLTGMEHQCRSAITEGRPTPEDLIEQLYSQLNQLRRNIETIRIIF